MNMHATQCPGGRPGDVPLDRLNTVIPLGAKDLCEVAAQIAMRAQIEKPDAAGQEHEG